MNKFKKGDNVYHAVYGWVVYDGIHGDGIHIIDAENNGLIIPHDDKELLSFTEYTLEGFSQERPEPVIDHNTVVYYRFGGGVIWRTGYYSHKSLTSHRVFANQTTGKESIQVDEISLTNPLI